MSTSVTSLHTKQSRRSSCLKKRIVVCCDGSWQDSTGNDKTMSNVTRIMHSIPAVGMDEDGQGIIQVTGYFSGIGTGNQSFYQKYLGRYIAGATGEGMAYNIREAYAFICNNYHHGDEITLFGFSRGAFTARSVSTLIKQLGLLTAEGLHKLNMIFDDWEFRMKPDYKCQYKYEAKANGIPSFRDPDYHAQLVRDGLLRNNIPVKCVAVWDTVGALGIPRGLVFKGTASQDFSFVDTRIMDNIEYAFHAMALDERRTDYAPTIWEKSEEQEHPKILKQTWFRGAHSDVGGGSDYNNDDLANLSLAWMIGNLEMYNILTFNRAYVYSLLRLSMQHHQDYERGRSRLPGSGDSNEDANTQLLKRNATYGAQLVWGLGKIHESYSGIFKFLGRGKDRTPCQYEQHDADLNSMGKRLVGTCESMHASVRVRMIQDGLGSSSGDVYKTGALAGWRTETDAAAVKNSASKGSKASESVVWYKNLPGRICHDRHYEAERLQMNEAEMTPFEIKIREFWEASATGNNSAWQTDAADRRQALRCAEDGEMLSQDISSPNHDGGQGNAGRP